MATSAVIVADTLQLAKARITTFQVRLPRFLLAELNTHRLISKSAESSRAVPVSKRIAAVQTKPFVPDAFGLNQPGMQAGADLDAISTKSDLWHQLVTKNLSVR